MNLNQKSSAEHIIEHLSAIDVDSETMEYIINKTNLKYEILKRLLFTTSDSDIKNLLEERDSIHDSGNNTHLS